MNSLIRFLGPVVVARAAPRVRRATFEATVSTLGDVAVAIGLARLILFGHQSKVTRKLPVIFETMGLIDRDYECFGGLASDAGMVISRWV
ncbi:MAG: hypothetical protein R3C03_03330 [Pirellulaceae bacterium]